MKQNKITTAEEFLSDNIDRTIFPFIDDDLEDNTQLAQTLKECLIKFTNLHVKAALEAASEKAKVVLVENCDDHTPYRGPCITCGRRDNPMIPSNEVDKDSILNAYSDENIK